MTREPMAFSVRIRTACWRSPFTLHMVKCRLVAHVMLNVFLQYDGELGGGPVIRR